MFCRYYKRTTSCTGRIGNGFAANYRRTDHAGSYFYAKFYGFVSSEAGVSCELSPVGVNGNGNISPSVNGTRTTSTSLFFNGIDATNITSNEGSLNDNISPAPETLQEIKLQTSLYDASTGRSGGGNFQLVTKSGGNNSAAQLIIICKTKRLIQTNFSLKKAAIEKPKADRTETGFTIGGPIIKDKFFFFGGYQFTDANTGLVPSARTRTILPIGFDCFGRRPFGGGDRGGI